jgi:hypothetical protein
MNRQTFWITAPSISNDASIWFSAYAFGWGYCAFSIPVESVCEQLGAADTSARQLMLAFELGKERIYKAVEQTNIPDTGDRVTLSRLAS